MVIYFDVVLLINLMMNFLILWLVAVVLNLEKRFSRLFAGAAVGCLFLLAVLSPGFAFLESTAPKIALSAAILVVSFWPFGLKDFLKILGFFYLISFMVGGGAFAFFYFFKLKDAFFKGYLLVNNISVPWWILLVSSSLILLFFKYMWPLIYQILSRDKLLVPVTVMFDKKRLELKALIDTGNDLHDPINDYPVIIVEFGAVKDLFNPPLREALEKGTEESLREIGDVISDSGWASRLRLIPFESIGKSKGMMVGFKPDLVVINFNNRVFEIKNAVIGIYQRVLSPDGAYCALLNPDILL
ncbi:sigma-E processing peptidase SpoIIGA [Thermoanaerobacterium sp. DL9XJH110]|uniref:sigma-E processing peptidase SpoIIGA n=1 Tax=Thermoanaerobacterium sp. DL9XJH110 TaxID=3386643 RepID=UPI003BB7271C